MASPTLQRSLGKASRSLLGTSSQSSPRAILFPSRAGPGPRPKVSRELGHSWICGPPECCMVLSVPHSALQAARQLAVTTSAVYQLSREQQAAAAAEPVAPSTAAPGPGPSSQRALRDPEPFIVSAAAVVLFS